MSRAHAWNKKAQMDAATTAVAIAEAEQATAEANLAASTADFEQAERDAGAAGSPSGAGAPDRDECVGCAAVCLRKLCAAGSRASLTRNTWRVGW